MPVTDYFLPHLAGHPGNDSFAVQFIFIGYAFSACIAATGCVAKSAGTGPRI